MSTAVPIGIDLSTGKTVANRAITAMTVAASMIDLTIQRLRLVGYIAQGVCSIDIEQETITLVIDIVFGVEDDIAIYRDILVFISGVDEGLKIVIGYMTYFEAIFQRIASIDHLYISSAIVVRIVYTNELARCIKITTLGMKHAITAGYDG